MPARRTVLGWLLLGGGSGLAAWTYRAGGLGAPSRQAAVDVPDDLCVTAPTFAHEPASGLPVDAPREVSAEARCPVCGMYPARQRRWAAQVIFNNGDVQYLDSPLNLFLYLQQVARYTPGQSADAILASYVTDLETGAWVPAGTAWYVHGSRRLGPMRSGNLPAFASLDQARHFAAQEGGEWLSADTLRKGLPAALQQLAPHAHHRHP